MSVKVAKFGGTSLADANHFRKVKQILTDDPARAYVVPSAPGKRAADDDKITDMLYKCYALVKAGEAHAPLFEKIAERYLDIARDLGLALDMRAILDQTCIDIGRVATPDFAASRGEYLCGILLADYLGWEFIDARDVIKFDRQGAFASEWTNEILAEALSTRARAVIPGFYGSFPDGEVRTFSRGGSDISGAVVARAAKADMYENWTDVSGFLMADPRIVKNPKEIRELSYQELRELSYMGATVLHEDSIFPVRRAGIPTNIRNTNAPEHPGTIIQASPDPDRAGRVITGIAGHKNFSLISIEKAMMNSELGFGRRVLEILEDFHISFEHLPTGIDTMSVIIADSELKAHKSEIVARIREMCKPESIDVTSGLALIATVGHGMVRNPGTAAKLFGALFNANVNVRMIDQGSSEMNIIVGVDEKDFDRAVRAIYAAFEPDTIT